MVCEHGVLRIPIIDPSTPVERYFGNCQSIGVDGSKNILWDFNTVDGREVQVRTLRRRCQHLGDKKYLPTGEPLMAKAQGCKNKPENRRPVIFTPVYKCAVYRRAAPFAQSIEDDFPPHPCYGCKEYQPCPPTTE